MQGPVQRSIAAAVEAVSGAVDHCWPPVVTSRPGCEGGLVADPTDVGPTDQQLRRDHRSDPSFGEQGGPGWVLLEQAEQLRVELGDLGGQETNRAAMSFIVCTATR